MKANSHLPEGFLKKEPLVSGYIWQDRPTSKPKEERFEGITDRVEYHEKTKEKTLFYQVGFLKYRVKAPTDKGVIAKYRGVFPVYFEIHNHAENSKIDARINFFVSPKGGNFTYLVNTVPDHIKVDTRGYEIPEGGDEGEFGRIEDSFDTTSENSVSGWSNDTDTENGGALILNPNEGGTEINNDHLVPESEQPSEIPDEEANHSPEETETPIDPDELHEEIVLDKEENTEEPEPSVNENEPEG